MIEHIHISGVRAIGELSITPGPFTVLVGANGCGKTTVLHCLDLLSRQLSDWEDTGTVDASGPGWRAFIHGKNSNFTADIPRMRLLQVDRNRLYDPSVVSTSDELVTPRGDHLAGAVVRLILEWPDILEAVKDDLRQIVPGFQNVRAKPLDHAKNTLRFDFETASDIPQEHMSTGTLLALLLLVVAHADRTETKGLTLLVDDLDATFHPGAQEELVRRLRDLTGRGKVQIIATTHSPYVVDAAGAENVWVLGPDNGGRTTAKRLDSHPDARQALEVLTAGEFWGSVGEHWVGKAV